MLAVIAIVIHRHPRTYVIFGLTAFAGVVLGASYRVLTADGIGANIGAGMVIFIAWPFTALIGAFAALLIYLIRANKPSPHRADASTTAG